MVLDGESSQESWPQGQEAEQPTFHFHTESRERAKWGTGLHALKSHNVVLVFIMFLPPRVSRASPDTNLWGIFLTKPLPTSLVLGSN